MAAQASQVTPPQPCTAVKGMPMQLGLLCPPCEKQGSRLARPSTQKAALDPGAHKTNNMHELQCAPTAKPGEV